MNPRSSPRPRAPRPRDPRDQAPRDRTRWPTRADGTPRAATNASATFPPTFSPTFPPTFPAASPPVAAGRPTTDADLDAAFARWRVAYHTIVPSADLVARVARAVRAPARRRRRRAVVAILGAVLTAFAGAHVATSVAVPLVGPPAGAPLTRVATRGPVAVEDPAAGPATAGGYVAFPPTRLAALLATATALPTPDAATRHAWVLASFDPDPRVREAAAILLALATPPTTERSP